MQIRETTIFRNPQVRANYEYLMEVAAQQGVEASVAEFRKLFSGQKAPTESEEEYFRGQAAAEARWALPGPHAAKMSSKTAESQKPSTEPLSEVGKQALENLRRYGGRPDLMLKENPHRVRKPMPDPGKVKKTTR